MKTTIWTGLSMGLSMIIAAGCVDHRDIRNGVPDENIYLPKDFLTRENPHRKDDHAWLYNVTVLKGSVPDIGAIYPGENSQPRYVEFQLKNNRLEMIEATEYAPLVPDPDGKLITSPSVARTVLNAWPGSHVDIRMRDNLDGERTNLIEENLEKSWKERQWFKVDFDKAEVADVNMLYWAETDYVIGDCMKLRSVSLVPDSFELEQDADKTGADKGDDYFSWTIAVTYELAVYGGGYYCGNQMTDNMDRSTYTYHVKYSFWRPPASDYDPVELAEKDEIRRKVGAFETGWGRLSVFHDPETDLAGAKSFLMRFNPNEPHTFYFSETFPEAYKEHFRTNVAEQFNQLMEENQIAMRINFKDWNADGKVRTFGDLRYSMLTYHNAPSSSGLIGMAYMNADPRTGEILSGGYNIYDWSDRLYTFLLEDYLKQNTKDPFDDKTHKNYPLSDSCKAGDVFGIDEKTVQERYQATSLLSKLDDYMKRGEPEKEEETRVYGNWVEERSPEFGDYFRKLLPDLRYAAPFYNQYVQREHEQWRSQMPQRMKMEQEFQAATSDIDHGESPFGTTNAVAPGAIETGLQAINSMKEQMRNHMELKARRQLLRGMRMMDSMEEWQLGPAMARSARKCKEDGTWETREEWAQRIIDTWFKVFSTHEFGHTLSLRHNFYGSIDKPNFSGNDFTSSIMEYSLTMAEAGDQALFHPYDLMALKWIYGNDNPTKDPNGAKDENGEDMTLGKLITQEVKNSKMLYCTDEHASYSPFCRTFDLGTTPTEIVKNAIEYYDWQYQFRNFRAYRKFWNTGYYASGVLDTLYSLRRFLNAWAIDFESSTLKNNLILLGVEGDEHFFANITNEFNEEFGQANRLSANFYKAILQQSAGERSYATRFDNFYGDIIQQGIILDKYFAMFLFVGLWPVDDYDQNLYSYLAYHESSFGNPRFYSDVQDVTDAMLGGQYDVYPWFVPTAVLLFAQDTHDVMFGDKAKQHWIALKRFDRISDMVDVFGFDPRDEALQPENVFQTFQDKNGETWIYYFVQDRNQHLVASKNRNPIAFKMLWDQNEDINLGKRPYVDDYQIKYFLDYYEYFN